MKEAVYQKNVLGEPLDKYGQVVANACEWFIVDYMRWIPSSDSLGDVNFGSSGVDGSRCWCCSRHRVSRKRKQRLTMKLGLWKRHWAFNESIAIQQKSGSFEGVSPYAPAIA